MSNQIDRTIQKTWQYWYVDGLVEIAGGLVVLAVAMFQAVLAQVQNGSAAAFVLAAGQPFIFLAGVFLARWAVRKAKERLTFPRTGYVTYPRPKRQRRVLTMVLAAAISIAVMLGLSYLLPLVGRNIIPAITGLFVALFMGYIGWRVGLPRFYVVGGAILLTGIAAAGLNLPETIGMILLLGVWGVGWLVAGAVTLRRYLNATAPVEA